MYESILAECKATLAAAGLIIPRTKLDCTHEFLSYTDGPSILYVGSGVRLLHKLGIRRLHRSVLHELFHILVFRVPPNYDDRYVFGTPDEWGEKQHMLRMLGSKKGYVSRYAKTHPEEDFVETALFVLGNGGICSSAIKRKVQAVEHWFDKIRRRKTRRKLTC